MNEFCFICARLILDECILSVTEHHSSKKAMYFAPWSPGEIFVVRTIYGHIQSQAKKLTLTRERECTVQKSHMHVLCSMVPGGDFCPGFECVHGWSW